MDKSIVSRPQAINIAKFRRFAFCRTNEEASYLVFAENDEIHLVSFHEGGKFYKICFDKSKGGEGKIEEASEILCEENFPKAAP